MELSCSVAFGGSYTLTTVVPSIFIVVHSTSLSVFDRVPAGGVLH